MPLALPTLDYFLEGGASTKAAPGWLIKIPFRSKEIYGVIKSVLPENADNALKLKTISEVIGDGPLLAPPEIEYILTMAEFYHVSPGFLLKMNLPPLFRPILKKGVLSAKPPDHIRQLKLKNVAAAQTRLLLYKNKKEQKSYLAGLLEGGGQKLVIVPALPDIPRLLKILPAKTAKQVIRVSSALTNKELTAAWIRIKNEKDCAVIGTRRAFFLPWHNLTRVVLFDESNPNHKSYDMSPRFHARDAADFLARCHGAELILFSHTPSVESYFFAEEKTYAGYKMIPSIQTLPVLIDLKDERKNGNYGPFGREALEAIKETPHGDIFIFINRLGGGSYIVCRDCEEPLVCSHCGKPLTYLPAGKLLRCNRCRETRPMITQCDRCGSVRLKSWGVGTQSAEAELKKILDGKDARPIWRVDSDNEIDLQKINKGGDKIIIGSEMAWPHINWEKVGLFIFLEADAPLFIPEYGASGNLFRLVRDAGFNLPATSRFFIQTAVPHHPLWQSLDQPEKFYKFQLAERKNLEYPPYTYLTRLLFGHREANIAAKEASRLAGILQNLTNAEFNIKINGPLETVPHYGRGKYWEVILAKIPFKYREEGIRQINEKLPPDWKTDPNPNTLLSI